jgi:hypothetical protein
MKTLEQLKSRLTELQAKSSYNKSEVMKNSHRMSRRYGGFNGDYLGECIDNENDRINKIAEEIDCLIYKINNYAHLYKMQFNYEVTQKGYNSTRSIGYMGAVRNS